MRSSLTALGFLAAIALPGCGPSATEGGFDSANPAARMYAIEQAARSGDQSAIRNLIEELDSDDPAVRMLAISTLERLTGETYGYRQYDSVMQRREAIARWVAADEAGTIPLRETSSSIATPQSSSAPAPATKSNGWAEDHG
jgi:HEAT repeat protein